MAIKEDIRIEGKDQKKDKNKGRKSANNQKKAKNSQVAEKTKVKKKGNKGVMEVPLAMKGLLIVVLGTMLTVLIRGFYPIWIGEIVAIAIVIIGWVIALVPAVRMRGISRNFMYLCLFVLLGLVGKLAELAFGMQNHLNDFGVMSFVELDVLIFAYLSIIAIIVAYSRLGKGMTNFVTGSANVMIKNKLAKKIAVFAIVFMMTLVLVPLSGGLPIYVEIIFTMLLIPLFALVYTATTAYIKKIYKYVLGEYPNFLNSREFKSNNKKMKKKEGKTADKDNRSASINNEARNNNEVKDIEEKDIAKEVKETRLKKKNNYKGKRTKH